MEKGWEERLYSEEHYNTQNSKDMRDHGEKRRKIFSEVLFPKYFDITNKVLHFPWLLFVFTF